MKPDGNTQHSEWSAWINKKFDEYRARGREYNLARFSRQFGATHSVVIGWMRPGAEPPRKEEYKKRIVAIYGQEAYKPLGLVEMQPEAMTEAVALTEYEKQALELFRQMPDDLQGDAITLLESFLFKHGFRRVR